MQPLPGDPVDVQDGYRRLSDLLGLGGQGLRIQEGSLQPQGGSVTFRFGDRHPPGDTAGGLSLTSGQPMSFGPVRNAGAWPIDRIWVRRTTAGTAATVAAFGVVG